MRYAIAFLILAGALGLAADRSAGAGLGVVAALEATAAVGLAALGVAYGLKAAGIPVEETVRHPRWSIAARTLLFPYRVAGGLTLALARRIDREPSRSQVGPGIWIGRYPSRSERASLAGAGIDAVLDLCVEFPHRESPGIPSRYLPILDGTAPSPRQFRDALAWIEALRSEGKAVLIHCAQGHGRSATIAAVALGRLGPAPGTDQAISIIQSQRPGARPSRDQRRAAARFLAAIDEASRDFADPGT